MYICIEYQGHTGRAAMAVVVIIFSDGNRGGGSRSNNGTTDSLNLTEHTAFAAVAEAVFTNGGTLNPKP